MKILFLFASVTTGCAGLWLFRVIAFVLPARDPSNIPMWRSLAFSFLAYSVLCWSSLGSGPRHAMLRWSVLTTSAAAIGVGLYGIVGMILRASGGGDFEGYIVLLGTILCGHGLTAIVYTVRSGRIARQTPAQV